MHIRLMPYPGSSCEAVTAIEADLERGRDSITLSYVARGNTAGLLLPRPAAPARADNLWRHTCFELFVRGANTPAYWEFNFSPSSEWAAYRFTNYRADMENAPIASPVIAAHSGAASFELRVSLESLSLPHGAWRVGLTAVIEETNARKSYWALAHAGAKPDFHLADSFTLELPE